MLMVNAVNARVTSRPQHQHWPWLSDISGQRWILTVSWAPPEERVACRIRVGECTSTAQRHYHFFFFYFTLASNLEGDNRSRVLLFACNRSIAISWAERTIIKIRKSRRTQRYEKDCDQRGLRCIRHVDAEGCTRGCTLSFPFFLFGSFARDTTYCSQRGLGGDWARGSRRRDALSASPPPPFSLRYHAGG